MGETKFGDKITKDLSFCSSLFFFFGIKSLKTRLLITSSSFRTTFGDKITKHLFFVHGEEKYAFFFGDKITKDSSFVYLFFFQDHFQSNALDPPLKTYLLLMGKAIYIFFFG